MKKEYLAFVPDINDLIEGQEIQITIRDLAPGRNKYNAKIVKAVVSHSPEKMPDADTLWVRSWIGVAYPDPWAIRITGEVGESVPGRPHGESLGEGELVKKKTA
jgi:hypothetical protein